MGNDRQMTEELRIAATLFDSERYEDALKKYRVLAELGNITAQLRLGWMYHAGQGVERNLTEAQKWYEKAATTESPQAQFYLGTLYRAKGEYQQAFEWLKRSASQGYSPAMYFLGQLYCVGEGVELNRAKAFQYFEQAADKGHLFAQRNIAREMIKGRRGIMRIPMGFILLVRVLCKGIKVTVTDPDSDTIRRV
jgi:uncharacterized protein